MPFIGTAIAWIGHTLAAGGVNAFLLRVGGSILLSTATSVLTRQNTQSASSRRQGQNITDTSPLAPLFMVYGQQRKGGKIVFMHTHTPEGDSFEGNKYMYVIVVVAANRCRSIGGIYFDDVLAVEAGAANGTGVYADLVSVWRANGDANQDAFPSLRSVLPDKWGETDRLRGLAAVLLRLNYDEKYIPAQIPNITFDVEGNDEVYDPRTETYGYSTNPALCLANYMAHPEFGWNAGIGAEGGINEEALIEAANICDEMITGADSFSARRYTLNGVVSLDLDPKDIVDEMSTSMAGDAAYRGGQWHILAGAYRIPTVSINEDDIVAGGIAMTTRHSAGENFNAVRGSFVSPINNWQADDFPTYASSTYVSEDDGEVNYRDITLPFTITHQHAQRLAKIELEKNRRQLTVEITGKLSCWRAAAGDTISLSYARWGIVNKPFLVQEMRLVPEDDTNLLVKMTLRETSPLVYDWSADEESIYDAASRTDLPSTLEMEPPGITTLSESLFVTRDGQGVKSRVTISWSKGDDFAASYSIQGRFEGGAWRDVITTPGLTHEIEDVRVGAWVFRVRAISTTGVASDWSPIRNLSVTGLTDPPGAVDDLSIQSLGGLALIKWRLASDLDVRIGGHTVIRHSSSLVPLWANSVEMDEVSGNVTTSTVPLMPGTYLVRFRDSSGNYGPVSTVFATGAQALDFAPVATLQEDDEFSGTHVGTLVVDGRLMIGSSFDIWSSPDVWATPDVWTGDGTVDLSATYVFASGLDFGEVVTRRLRRDVIMQGFVIDNDVWRILDVWSHVDVWGSSTSDVNVRVEISTTNDDPSGATMWSDYSVLDSAEVSARAVRARAILTTTDPSVSPLVERLRISVEKVT